eukprot:5180250-Prymnesium_polylepis.1
MSPVNAGYIRGGGKLATYSLLYSNTDSRTETGSGERPGQHFNLPAGCHGFPGGPQRPPVITSSRYPAPSCLQPQPRAASPPSADVT